MCLLTFFPSGQMPDTSALRNGSLFNDDGHGWAIVAKKGIISGKYLDAEEAIRDFAEIRAHHLEGPALFHSRLATHGIISEYNVHPFSVGRDGNTVLGHNGILPTSVQPGKKDIRSDTRITAEDFFGKLRLGPWWTRKGIRRYSAWMGYHNKIVILTANPVYGRNHFIFNESSGTWHDGIWYSNSGYMPHYYKVGTGRYTTYSGDSTEKWERYFSPQDRADKYADCLICLGKAIVDPVLNICTVCNVCNDCGEDATYSCMCYTPSHLSNSKVAHTDETDINDTTDDPDRRDSWPETHTLGYPLQITQS